MVFWRVGGDLDIGRQRVFEAVCGKRIFLIGIKREIILKRFFFCGVGDINYVFDCFKFFDQRVDFKYVRFVLQIDNHVNLLVDIPDDVSRENV